MEVVADVRDTDTIHTASITTWCSSQLRTWPASVIVPSLASAVTSRSSANSP